MFLHAHLTVEYLLQQQTKGDVLEKIKQRMLPEGLSEMYASFSSISVLISYQRVLTKQQVTRSSWAP